MSLVQLVSLYCARGYAVRTTLRGNIEVCAQQRVINLCDYPRKNQCPQQ